MDDTSIAPLPDWIIPPHGGFTADDFLQLRGLPRHTELIDGSLIFVSSQEHWHSQVNSLLEHELDRQAPEELRAVYRMAVRLDKRQVPIPDIAVITSEAFNRAENSTNFWWADDVVLVVEAVSPDSDIRDREIKPRRYAAAGIRHFWRVEHVDSKTVAYAYERDPATAAYVLTGIHHNQLATPVPFEIDIDLTAVGRRPR